MKKQLLKRYFVFILGVLINSFGIGFITKAALGTSPISSVPCVLSLKFNPTLGEFTFVMNMIFILLQVILLRKKFQKIQFLQIVVNIIFSGFIDVSMFLLQVFTPDTYIIKLFSLLFGCAILAFGIYLEVAANVLMVPGEGVVAAIANVTKKEFGSIKVCFDVTLMLTATLLSLLFFHQFQGIREGTIISAFIVGLIVKLYHKKLGFIKAHLCPQLETVS